MANCNCSLTSTNPNFGAGVATWNPGNQLILNKNSVYVLNVKSYGAKGDCRAVFDGSISSGSNQLHSSNAAFTSADVSKQVCVVGAGPSGGALMSTISSVS